MNTSCLAAPSLSLSIGADFPLEEMKTAWLSFVDRKPQTLATYERAIRAFWSWMTRHKIAAPVEEDIKAWRDDLSATGHAAATVALYLGAVKSFFRFCAKYTAGLIVDVAKDVRRKVSLPREHRKDSLSAKQVASILSKIDRSTAAGLRDYALISLMATSGIRCIEAERANIEDVTTRQGNAVLYIQGKGRDSKAEYVKLAAPVENALKAWMKVRPVTVDDMGRPAKIQALFVGTGNRSKGERLTTRSLSMIAKEAMKAAGINSPRLTAHSMRHTAACLNMLNGGTLEETQQLLRHSNISTTMIYAHALKRDANKSEERVADAIFS